MEAPTCEYGCPLLESLYKACEKMQQKFTTQRSCIVSAELGKRDTAAADAFTSFIKCFRQFLCIEMVLEQIIHRAVLQVPRTYS